MGIFLMMKSRATILVALLILGPSIALAQDALETLRAMNLRAAKLASPSLFGIPSAGTMGHRRSFVAGSAATQSRTDTGDLKLDASAALGLGLGNAVKTVGLDAYLGIISVNPEGKNGGFGVGEDGNVSLKLGKAFYTNELDRFSIAIGGNNLIAWGDAEEIDENIFAVGSYATAVMINDHAYGVSISLGAGTKQKSSTSFGAFAGLGLKAHPSVDVALGFNANRWVAGITVPLGELIDVEIGDGIYLQVGVDDVLDDQENRRGVMNVSIPFQI